MAPAFAARSIDTPLDQLAVPVRRDQRRCVRRAGSSTADLRRDAGHHRPRRASSSSWTSSCSTATAARPATRRRNAPCPPSCATRCWRANARCRDSRCWSSAIPSTMSTAASPRPISPRCATRASRWSVIDLDELRDSNFIYSAFWRLTMKWWSGDGSGDGWLPNPLAGGPEEVTFGAWARLLNFKANHRKVLIADDGKRRLTGIVTSANPHDASSRHSNVALKLTRRGAAAAAGKRAGIGARIRLGQRLATAAVGAGAADRQPGQCRARAGAHRGRDRRGHPAQLRADPRRRQHRHRDVLSIRSQRHPGADRRRQAWRRGAGDPRPQQGRLRPREERHPEPLGGRGTGRRLRWGDQAALVSARTASSSTPSSWRCVPPTNSGSRWDRPISRAAISATTTSRPTSR